MADPFEKLKDAPRLLMEARLKPLQGQRFQPTGFADLGPARYQSATNVSMLLVESAQSVANWLEAMIWDPPQLGRLSSPNANLANEVKDIPFVKVTRKDKTVLTNSLIEAHRLNSPYIMRDDAFKKRLTEELRSNLDGPLDVQVFSKVVFRYDPNAVLHGVMLEEIAGRLRLPRLISGFIEASDVKDAAYGGVMNNIINPKGIEGHGGSSNILYHRSDFTGNLVAFFNLDLAQLRGYGLGASAETFLTALALFKIRRFLKSGLRLRTACDLDVDGELKVTRPDGFAVPDEKALAGILKEALAACKKESLFADPPVTTVVYEEKKKSGKDKTAETDAAEEE